MVTICISCSSSDYKRRWRTPHQPNDRSRLGHLTEKRQDQAVHTWMLESFETTEGSSRSRLGLYITQSIVDQRGWSIEAEMAEEEGSLSTM